MSNKSNKTPKAPKESNRSKKSVKIDEPEIQESIIEPEIQIKVSEPKIHIEPEVSIPDPQAKKESKPKKVKIFEALKEKKVGVVKQIEDMIVSILKDTPMSRKDLQTKCPDEFNSATWNTRISRLKAKGIITQDESKLLKITE